MLPLSGLRCRPRRQGSGTAVDQQRRNAVSAGRGISTGGARAAAKRAKHECVFSTEKLATQNPIVEVLAPAGVEPAYRPGTYVRFEAAARNPDSTPIADASLAWEFFLNTQSPGGTFVRPGFGNEMLSR